MGSPLTFSSGSAPGPCWGICLQTAALFGGQISKEYAYNYIGMHLLLTRTRCKKTSSDAGLRL